MDSTSIKYEQVASAAASIKNNENAMRAILDEFTKEMNAATTEDVFAGKASESLKGRFNELKGKFDEYIKIVDEFANMISRAGQQTEQTEANIQHLADEMPR